MTDLYYNPTPTINFIGAVDDSVGSMSISDKIHTILLTVEGPFRSDTENTKKKKSKFDYLKQIYNYSHCIYDTLRLIYNYHNKYTENNS